jgi:hypothetical protein
LLVSFGMFAMRQRSIAAANKDKAKPADKPPAPIRSLAKDKLNVANPVAETSATETFPAFDDQANDLPAIKATPPQLSDGQSTKFFPPPADKPLPKSQQSRLRVAIPFLPMRGYTFDRAYKEAFDAFTEVNALEKEKGQTKDRVYNEKLGRTIAMLQAARSKMGASQSQKQADEINQLLTFLYFRAGRLPEAAILAEAAARWGDPKKEGTKESTMVGLAAMQEANLTHWANPNQVGELEQMATIIRLFAKRWPNDQRLGQMKMGLAQSFDQFGKHARAARAYDEIPADSEFYGQAQLAAGSALWTEYRKQVAKLSSPAANDLDTLSPIRDQARERLAQGVKSLIDAEAGMTAAVMSAKLNLARIELSAGQPDAAEKWLAGPRLPLTDSIGTKAGENIVAMPVEFVRVVFETLFSIQFGRNDLASAKVTVQQMSKLLGKKHSLQVGKLHLSIATKYAKQLASQPSVSRSQLSTLANLIDPLKQSEDALKVADLLWLGESWAKLAPRAMDETSTKQCFFKAAAAYQLAMQRDDFPTGSSKAAVLRRLELLAKAGRLNEALTAMTALLEQSPNAFAMQIQAAQAMLDLAEESGDPDEFSAALNGPADSPIWGWNQLVSVLQSQPSSDETNARDTARLMQCRYNMLRCRWQIAKSIDDQTARGKEIAKLQQIAKRLKTTMKPSIEPWFGRFETLSKKLE